MRGVKIICLLICTLITRVDPGASLAAQQPRQGSGQTFRVRVSLVQTDVMVFDRDGRFVDGLGQDQFELRVDGKPRSVSFFESISAGSASDEGRWSTAAAAATRNVPVPVASSSDRGRSIFFFVDDAHLSPDSIHRVQGSLLRSIDKAMGNNDQAAVVLASGRGGFLEQLTDNPQVLRSAAMALNYWDSGVLDNEKPVMQEHQALAIEQRNSDVIAVFTDATMRDNGFDPKLRPLADRMVRDRAAALARRSSEVTKRTLDSLANTVKSSASIPGRKLLFFLSDGFILHPQAGSVFEQLARVRDAAARAGVVIYSIDARGLIPDVDDPSNPGYRDAAGRLASSTGSAILAAEDGPFNLAVETGGRFLHNTNSLDGAIAETLSETARYYMLGWQWDRDLETGRKRATITVTIPSRPDLTVRVRQGNLDLAPLAGGVVSDDSRQHATDTDPLLEAIQAPHPGGALKTDLYVARLHESGQGWRLAISFEVAGGGMSSRDGGGQPQSIVDVLGMVFNEKGEKVLHFGRKIISQLGSGNEPRRDLTLNHVVPVEPGLYQVRVVAREASSGSVGAAHQWVDVPPFAANRLALSSIFLSTRPSSADAAEGQGGSDGSLALGAARRFRPSTQLAVVLQIYNPTRRTTTASPDVAVTMRVFRGSLLVVEAPPRTIDTPDGTDAAQLSYGAALALRGLSPGIYSIEVAVTDRVAKSSAVERTHLTIQ